MATGDGTMTIVDGSATSTADAVGTERFGPFTAISLEQIIERASLQTRVERKYVIPPERSERAAGRAGRRPGRRDRGPVRLLVRVCLLRYS
jgi:hypothetical protein